MSASQNSGNNTKAWVQELKSNRKTQVALAMFVLVIGYFSYELFAPNIGKSNNRQKASAPRNIVGQPLEDAQVTALQRLPNLAGLYKAGELPSENRMYRDLFVFDSPPPPPPIPPTPEEIAARERRAAMDREVRGQPSSYQFIAILQGLVGPRQSVLQDGDDFKFLKIGDEATPNWKLVVMGDEELEFQNTKFEELKFVLKAPTGASGQTSGQRRQVTNLF